MSQLTRLSVSLEKPLLEAFDRLVEREGYPTRSEAVKALIRKALIEEEWHGSGTVAGTMMLVYDHHRHDSVHKLMHIQHDFGNVVISAQHVHLDQDNCLEMVTVKGRADRIRQFAKAVKAVKGLKHSMLLTTTGGAGVP